MKNIDKFKFSKTFLQNFDIELQKNIWKTSIKYISSLSEKIDKDMKQDQIKNPLNKESSEGKIETDKIYNNEKNLKLFKEANKKNSILNSKTYISSKSPIIINNDYEVLLYHNKISTLKATLLCMKYILPITTLYYLIKINPFYMSFPVMLPIMTFSLFFYMIAFLQYISSLQKIVEEIWLDRTGAEIKVIYRNRRYRKFRGNVGTEILLNDSLVSPDEKEYIFLKGDVFPKKYPPSLYDFMNLRYFWHKYYLSRKNYFLLAKKATYMDYELLINVFNGKNINLSQAITLFIDENSLSYKDYKKTLNQINQNKNEQLSSLIKPKTDSLKIEKKTI